RQLVELLEASPAQVRWIESDSTKPGPGRNAGVAAARGAFVLLADGGELLTPGFATSIVDHLSARPRAALVLPVRGPHDTPSARTPAWTPVVAPDAVAGPWSFGTAVVIARAAFDRL